MKKVLFTPLCIVILWNLYALAQGQPVQGIFFPSSTQLHYYDINENILYPYCTLPDGASGIDAVAIDLAGNLTQGVPKVYFSVNSSGSIMRCNLLDTCSGLETIYQYGSSQIITGISLNFQLSRIYWVAGSSVARTFADGSGFQTILSSLSYPFKVSASSSQVFVALSSKNGNLDGDGVETSLLNGASYSIILASSLKNAKGVCVDDSTSTLYVTDSGKDSGGGGNEKIISSVATLVTGDMETPEAIALHGNTNSLYWIDSTLKTLNKYDLVTGIRSTVYTFTTSGGIDIALYEADVPLNVTIPPSPSPTPSRTPSASASISTTPSISPTPSVSITPSPSPSSSPSPQVSITTTPSPESSTGNSTSTNPQKKNGDTALMVAAVVLPTACLVCTGICLAIKTVRKKKRIPEQLPPPPDVEGSRSDIPTETATKPTKEKHIYVDLGSHSARNSMSFHHVTITPVISTISNSDENDSPRARGLTTRGSSKSLNSYEIDFDEIDLGKELGRGAYGIVYLGEYRHQKVAVKKLLKSDLTHDQIEEFKEEGLLMCSLKPHKNVVTTLGLCVGKELCIVTEFMPMGSLQSFLQLAKLEMKRVITIGMDIAAGMAHLAREGIVHRDLAARNLLLTENLDVKISDFGMARVLESKEESSGKTASTTGPLKWMAPESIKDGEYSTKSDVWAFGITMIEILTRNPPYPDQTGVNVCLQVVGGMTHPIPEGCPEELGTLLQSCWTKSPENRPSFDQIFKYLHSICPK